MLLIMGISVPKAMGNDCELHWYLAASLTKPGTEIVQKWNKIPDNCSLYLILGGSGQILNQLTLSKKGDLYSPASDRFLDLAKQKNIVKKYQLLLKQIPVFALSASGSSKVASFSDLRSKEVRIALGNPKTMALGEIYMGIENKMTPDTRHQIRVRTVLEAINLNQILNYLKTGVVDVGIAFDTSAKASKLAYIHFPDALSISQNAYLVTTRFTRHEKEVRDIVHFISQQKQIFRKYGFKLSLKENE